MNPLTIWIDSENANVQLRERTFTTTDDKDSAVSFVMLLRAECICIQCVESFNSRFCYVDAAINEKFTIQKVALRLLRYIMHGMWFQEKTFFSCFSLSLSLVSQSFYTTNISAIFTNGAVKSPPNLHPSILAVPNRHLNLLQQLQKNSYTFPLLIAPAKHPPECIQVCKLTNCWKHVHRVSQPRPFTA